MPFERHALRALMSKKNDALNEAQKSKKTKEAVSAVLKDVWGLLGDIRQKPEEVIKKRRGVGVPPPDGSGELRAFGQTYQFESGTQLKDFQSLLDSTEKRIEEIRRQAEEHGVRVRPKSNTREALSETLNSVSLELRSRVENNRRASVERLLADAKVCFEKNDIGQTITLLENAAGHFDAASGFKVKIAYIRSLHQELLNGQRDLTRELLRLTGGLDPEPSDVRFLDSIHHSVQTQVKDIHAALRSCLDLKTGRRRFVVSGPVVTLIFLLAIGAAGIWSAYLKTQSVSQVRMKELLAFSEKENSNLKTQNSDLASQISALKNQHRSKLSDVESRLQEAGQQNTKLSTQVKLLTEENLAKDRAIAQFSPRPE